MSFVPQTCFALWPEGKAEMYLRSQTSSDRTNRVSLLPPELRVAAELGLCNVMLTSEIDVARSRLYRNQSFQVNRKYMFLSSSEEIK